MNATFPKRFEEVVKRQPSRIALEVDGSVNWSYARLHRYVHAIASRLTGDGMSPGSVIGVALDKSPEYIAVLIAVWRMRCVAVPVASQMPVKRKTECLRRAKASLTIDQTWLDGVQSEERPDSAARSGAPLVETQHLTASYPDPTDPAYLFFTSGSTGRPKGVLVSHEGLVPMLEAQISTFQLDSETRSLFYLSIAFDASLSDIGTCLLAGGTLLLESDLERLSVEQVFSRMTERRVTYADLPPSLLTHATSLRLDAPPTLHTIVMGGEVCPEKTIEWWAQRVRLVNVYGPTEATVCTSMEVCTPQPTIADEVKSRSIGIPIASASYRLEPTKDNAASSGELWIGGPAVALGYVDDPQLTENRFQMIAGKRWFRTGDRVQQDASGEWFFAGRIDRQFKLLGKLVEPVEIERCLSEIEGVAVASVFPIGAPQVTAIGCLLEHELGVPLDVDYVVQQLRVSLPDWMIPLHIRIADQIPRLETGKLDVAAAVKLVSNESALQTECKPDPVAAQPFHQADQMRQIWEETLEQVSVGWDDDFFLLGGDSLSALRLVAKCESEGIAFSTSTLYRERTLRRCVADVTVNHSRSTSELEREVAKVLPMCRGAERNAWPSQQPEDQRKRRHILLTGATGLVGGNVLRVLVDEGWCQITCLVRAEDSNHARDRLVETQRRFVRCPVSDCIVRVSVVCGDVSRHRLGLADSDWQRLVHDVTDVVHLAANVSMTQGLEDVLADNVHSVARAVHFAREGHPKSLWYASTLSVFVATDRQQESFEEMDDLSTDANVFGGYGQSKWIAERLVQSQRHIPLGIFRLGLIARETIDPREPTDQLSRFTQGIAEMGIYPKGCDSISFDLTPVDYSAHAINKVVREERVGVYHLCGERSVSLGEWVQAMRAIGIPLQEVSIDLLLEQMGKSIGRCRSDAAAAAFLALRRRLSCDEVAARHREHDLFLATGVHFSSQRADEALAEISWRRKIDTQRLQRIVLSTGVTEPSTARKME